MKNIIKQLAVSIWLMLSNDRAMAQTMANYDLAVTHLYTLDQRAQVDGALHTVRAIVVNRGQQYIHNAVVRLRVSGANPLTQTAVISLFPGRDAMVTFGAHPPGQLGRQRLSVRVPADDNPANDSLVVNQTISNDTTSYVTRNEPAHIIPGAQVWQLESALANRFSVSGTPRLIRSVRAYIVDTASVGQVVVGFVADPTTGRVLGRSTQRVLRLSDINRMMNFDLAEDLVLQNRDYLAGFSILGRAGAPVRQEGTTYGCQKLPYYPPTTHYALWPLSWISTGETPPQPPSDLSLANPPFPDSTSSNYLIGKLMVEVITAVPPACARPANLAVTVRGGPFRVEFDSAYSATGYELAYGPTGFDPDRATATGGQVVAQRRGPFFAMATMPGATYNFYVRSVCGGAAGRSAWAGPVFALAPCTNSGIFQFPYREGFDALPPGQPFPCGAEVLDADNNRTSWRVQSTLNNSLMTPLWNSPPNGLYLNLSQVEDPVGGTADDWFFTPPLALRAGRRYRLSFQYQNLSSGGQNIDRLAVWLGDAPDPVRQNTLLYRNPQISNFMYLLANAATTPAVQAVTVPTDGLYHLGFQAYSQQLPNFAPGNGYRLLLDDIELADAGPLAAGGAAAVPGLALYPNPAADGRFTLQVPAAATVRVADALGRAVYAGPVAARTPLALDLSQRPAGVYVLRVCTPAGCETRKLVVGPGR